MNVALFASGRGSNVNNILCYFNENEKINIVVVGSNNPNSGALEYAKKHNVPVFTFSKNELNNSSFIINKLQKYNVSLIALAGFVLKIPEEFISLFKGDIINVLNVKKKVICTGITAYPANEAKIIAGAKSDEIEKLLGYHSKDVVIHRDDMVIR